MRLEKDQRLLKGKKDNQVIVIFIAFRHLINTRALGTVIKRKLKVTLLPYELR